MEMKVEAAKCDKGLEKNIVRMLISETWTMKYEGELSGTLPFIHLCLPISVNCSASEVAEMT